MLFRTEATETCQIAEFVQRLKKNFKYGLEAKNNLIFEKPLSKLLKPELFHLKNGYLQLRLLLTRKRDM